MSRLAALVLVVLLIAAGAFAGAELFSFRVRAVVDHGQLEWTTGQETNLQSFTVERSSDGSSFVPVGQMNAKGSFSEYHFTDSSPLDADINRVFYYRLKMIDRNGTYVYSEVRDVALSFSAVQHTWGSIKAMFR
jgi:hypothetical protein